MGSAKKSKSKEVKRASFPGFLDALRDFVNQLVEMERKEEKEGSASGQVSGVFSTDYKYRVKIGTGPRDFRPSDKKPRMSKEKVKIRRKPVDPIEVLERGDHVSVMAYLPFVEPQDIGFKVVGNNLRIAARTSTGRIEKEIPVKGGKIENARFENGTLKITIKKRGR